METSQLICRANQLTGFNMRETLAFNGLSLPRENIWILMTRWLNNIWVLITPDIFWNSSLMPSKMQYPSLGQVNRSSVFVGNHLEMVTQKKYWVASSYRLASGRESGHKISPLLNLWNDKKYWDIEKLNCTNGSENFQSEDVMHSRTSFRCRPSQTVIQWLIP